MTSAAVSPSAPATLSFSDFQNPFALSRLRANLRTLWATEGALNQTRAALPEKCRDALTGDAAQRATVSRVLQLAKLGAESALETERRKPSAVRTFSHKTGGADDSWGMWAVLSRDVSARIIALAESRAEVTDRDGEPLCAEGIIDAHRDALRAVCAELWAEWGFDASASPLSDYSPTGRMFSRSLSAYVSSGCVVLSQSGARDV